MLGLTLRCRLRTSEAVAAVPGARPPCRDPHLPESRRARPGPEVRAGGSRARTSAYLTRGERTTAAAVERTALHRENFAACLRLPRGGRRTQPTPEEHFPASSTSATSYLCLALRPVKPHFPEGCAFARALGAQREKRLSFPRSATVCSLRCKAALLGRAHEVSRGQQARALRAS